MIVSSTEDESPPQLLYFQPEKKAAQTINDLQIQAWFSEAIDSNAMTENTWELFKKPDTKIPLTKKWISPLQLELIPIEPMLGGSYRLEATEFEIADLAGNRLGDSLREFSFSVLDDDSLGWVSGEVAVDIPGKETHSVVLTAKGLKSDISYDLSVTDGIFYVQVPAGEYLFSAFVDSDGNGEKGNGSVSPFRLAETMFSWPDTISVRPRFETAGVELQIR